MEENRKQRKIKDNPLVYTLILVGALVVALLVLVGTGFTKYLQMYNSGYAIGDQTLSVSLSKNPDDEEIKKVVALTPFEELEYIYKQGNRYFLGEKQKEEIQISYPLFVEDSLRLQIVDADTILVTPEYESASSYSGMYIQQGVAYNPDGERADATDYIFMSLTNGNFVNLTDIGYRYKGEDKVIPANSIVHFTKDFVSYYMIKDGEGIYDSIPFVSMEDIFCVGGVDITYRDLLLNLNVIHEVIENENVIERDDPVEVEEEVVIEVEEPEPEIIPPAPEEEVIEEATRPERPAKEQTVSEPQEKPAREPKQADNQPNQGTNTITKYDRGVRPGTENTNPVQKEKVKNYVKPEVSVKDVSAGVYRVFAELEVKDPAERLHSGKKAQVEVYELDSKGNKTLVGRGYKGAPGGKVTVGGGTVKPDTKYFIQISYTYYDEYDELTVEYVGDYTVETGSVSDLGPIYLNQEVGELFNNKIQIKNVTATEDSDAEAVYGLSAANGLMLIVDEKNAANGLHTESKFDRSSISAFKSGSPVSVTSLPILSAKTEYDYEIKAYDYFGNELTIINNTGTVKTSKNAPKAEIELDHNAIGDVGFNVKFTDIDSAFVPIDSSANPLTTDIYFAVVPQNFYTDDKETVEANSAYFARLDDSEYTITYNAATELYEFSLNSTSTSFVANSLLLDTTYEARVYANYDLENGYGPKEFQNIGSLQFKSSGLSTLGSIYVSGNITGVTEDSAVIDLSLNKDRTNSELYNLLTGLKLYVTPDASKNYKDNEKTMLRGFDKDSKTSDVPPLVVYEEFINGSSYRTILDKNLTSMTDYYIYTEAICEYAGNEYRVNVILDVSGFKTLRATPTVQVIDPVFAGGQIVFDCTVLDEDGAITGNSGDTVVLNLYQKVSDDKSVFVKKVRVNKSVNRDNLIVNTVKFENIDMTKEYYVDFVAVEYNNGYTNVNYEANKVIHTEQFLEGIDYTGTIRLQNLLEKTAGGNTLQADFKIAFKDDNDQIPLLSEGDGDYYVRITKYPKGESVPIQGEAPVLIGFEKDKDLDDILWTYDFSKAEYDVTVELLVKIGNRELSLDQIKFSIDQEIIGFSNTYEFIKFIKDNPEGRKYVATADIELISNKTYYPIDGDATSGVGLSGNVITSILNSDVDFQGFKLEHHFMGGGQPVFSNIGPKGSFRNCEYVVTWENAGAVADTASLCTRNYGTIKDIFLDFRGGTTNANYSVGLITRQNAATGVIENFVIHNNPEEGTSAFAVRNNGGLVCYINYGTIRNGYVYGEDIYSAFYDKKEESTNKDRMIGGICGRNYTVGQVSNCYSLVGIDFESFASTWAGNRYYGTIVGYSSGYTGNMYSSTRDFPKTDRGPVVGYVNGKKYENLYYYSMQNTEYEKSSYAQSMTKQNTRMSIDNLYDTGWQSVVLGDQFIMSTVELGYYPHVILSPNLPEQDYIELPTRKNPGLVEISQSEVISYDDTVDNESAYMMFRFKNESNAEINYLTVEGLTVELDTKTAKSADGFTTVYGTVSKPTMYKSTYNVEEIGYTYNGAAKKKTYTGNKPIIAVDFYRNIRTAEDWYNFMVLNAKKAAEDEENVRLQADIDFADVATSKIRVTDTFSSKLDGNNHKISNIDLTKDKAANNGGGNTSITNLFSNTTVSIDMTGVVKNLYIENYKAGGQKPNRVNNPTYIYSSYYPGLIYRMTGSLENVHVINEELTGFSYTGGLVCYAYDGASITNCTINNLTIKYMEPTNTDTDAYIGGIVGRIDNGRISNCYVKNINVTANDMRNNYGAGGIVGYSYFSVLENLYSTGDIEIRGNKTGGIVGEYLVTDNGSEGVICINNVISKVNIICYTDVAGGIAGSTNVTDNMISDTNNVSGVAFGDVYGYNPDVDGISHTIGRAMGKQIKLYGCETQLINGITTTQYNPDVCLGLLTYDEATNPDTYISRVKMSKVFNYEPVSEGYIPHLYYKGTATELPFQGTDGYPEVAISDKLDSGVDILDIQTNSEQRIIRIKCAIPNDAEIAGFTIEDLQIEDDYTVDYETVNGQKEGVILVKFVDEAKQTHCLDSYVLSSVSIKENGQINKVRLISRIPVTLYHTITQCSDWNGINVDYENYRIIADLDFSTYGENGYCNKKIGRVEGRNTSNGVYHNQAIISGIKINNGSNNFISRLNSSLNNVRFENVNIKNKGKNGIGLVGASFAEIKQCDFNDININCTADNSYVAIIGYQVANKIHDCNVDNVHINMTEQTRKQSYSATLVGYMADMGEVTNVKVYDSEVYGYNYVGGLVGYSYAITYDNIYMENMLVRSTKKDTSYCGGMVGCMGSSDVCHTSAKCDNITLVGRITNEGASNPINSTVLNDSGIANDRADADKVKKGATSTFTVEGYSYVGGIAGRAYIDSGDSTLNNYSYTRPDNSNPNYTNLVSGVRVNGSGNYIGGAYGDSVWYENWIEVNDCYISAKNQTGVTDTMSKVGGLSGRGYRRIALCSVRNCYIDTVDYNQVGGLAGFLEWASINYNVVEDSTIDARVSSDANKGKRQDVGGLVGYTSNNQHIEHCMVFNTDVLAEDLLNVGGMLGRHLNVNSTGYISYGQCLGDVDDSKANTIDAAVAKSTKVIGYSNVGGIVGYQNSGYVYQCTSNVNVEATGTDSCAGGIAGYYNNGFISNSNGTKTASTARSYYNISLCSVKAVKYAGGLYGRTGMCAKGVASGLRQKGANGSSYDEATYTYSNLVICNKIDAAEAHPIAGDVENFSSRTLRAWTETMINGVSAYEATSSILGTVDLQTANSIDRKAFSSAAYATKLVNSEDLKNDYLYYNMNFIGSLTSSTNPANGIYRVFINGKKSATNYGYTAATGDYLPIMRHTSSTSKNEDAGKYMLKRQKRFIANAETKWLPIPTTNVQRAVRLRAMAAPLSDSDNTAPDVYASSVSTVNITWPEWMVCDDEMISYGYGYYYQLYVDGELIDIDAINTRTVTFTYDFMSDVTVVYGEFYKEGDEIVYSEYDSEKYEALDLAKHIDVYKDKFYYLNSGVLMSGNASGDITEASDDLFINIYAGYGLNTSGEIVKLEDVSVVGYLGDIETIDTSVPMYSFNLLGYTFDTYSNYTTITSRNSVSDKNGQIFVFYDTLYTIDGNLKNDKDALLVYSYNAIRHQTVLMESGEITDLYADEPILPEKFTNENIIDMTNNICSTIPVALVEYADGGIVGYNYKTGELLFEENVEPITFMNYVANFFSDVFSAEAKSNASNFKVNEQIADELNKGNNVLENHGAQASYYAETSYEGTADGQGQSEGIKVQNSEEAKNVGENTETSVGSNEADKKAGYELINGDGELVSESAEASGDGKSDGKGTETSGGKVSDNGEGTDKSELNLEGEVERKDSNANETAKNNGGFVPAEDGKSAVYTTPSNGTVIATVVGNSVDSENVDAFEISQEAVYMIVFNATTGSYDVVNTFEYVTNPAYVSENERIGVTDLSEVANIVAVAENNKKDANGLLIYLSVALVTIAVAGVFIMVDRKKRKNG